MDQQVPWMEFDEDICLSELRAIRRGQGRYYSVILLESTV